MTLVKNIKEDFIQEGTTTVGFSSGETLDKIGLNSRYDKDM